LNSTKSHVLLFTYTQVTNSASSNSSRASPASLLVDSDPTRFNYPQVAGGSVFRKAIKQCLNENAYSGEAIVRTSKNHQTGRLLAIRSDLLRWVVGSTREIVSKL